MGKSVRDPIGPEDFFSDMKGVPDDYFSTVNTPENRTGIFNPKSYENVKGATPFDDPEALQSANINNQTTLSALGKGFKVAGANALSSLGQSIASTFDLIGAYQTAKGVATDSNDDFNSSLLGVDTRDMADWSNKIARDNQALERDPGSFSPGDVGWWANTALPQVGTLVGTAVGALATTAAIEAATDGGGTSVAAANLLNGIKKAWGSVKAGEIIQGGLDLAKGMKGAAAMYATISRYSEARFEAQNNYMNTMEKLNNAKKPDGTEFTQEEKDHLASAGARVDFGLTLAQLPLDILAMRAMIFNPLIGSATGGLERGLEKVAGLFGESKLGKLAGTAVTHGIGAGIEGLEAGGIPIFQAEGEHHAMVLAGLENDKSSWVERVGKDIQSPEFANMIATGVLGSLLIGPAMNATKSLVNYNRTQQFNDKYKNYTNNVVPSLSNLANSIKQADADGDTQGATILRRRFNASRALDALHLDTQAGKSDMFNAHVNFLQSTLDQVNKNDPQNIKDLFGDASPEQIQQVKNEYQTFIDDAKGLKDIYNTVGQRYNRNLVPVIAEQHFQLNNLLKQQQQISTDLATQLGGLSQYTLLSPQGKQIHDSEYQLAALNHENTRLTGQLAGTENEHEREPIKQLLAQNKQRLTEIASRVSDVNADEAYTPAIKDADNDIINSSLKSRDYQQAIYNNEHLNNLIALQRKKIGLWNKSEYLKSIQTKAIKGAKTIEQVNNNIPTDTTKVEPEVAQAIIEKKAEIEASNAADTVVEPGIGNSNLFAQDEGHINNIADTVDTENAGHLAVDNTGVLTEKLEEAEKNIVLGSLDPYTYDFNNSSQEAKQKIKDGVNGLLHSLGEDASFEDLVRHVVKAKGVETADKIYNAIRYGWEANGKVAEDYDAIYQKVFGNPLDQLIDGSSQLLVSTVSQVQQVTNQITDNVVASGEEPEGFDENNQPIYVYKSSDGGIGYVTNEASPKMAFVTIASKLIRQEIGNTVEISHEYTDDELNQGDYVDSTQLLDPTKWVEGTEAEIRVPNNLNSIKIPIFKPDGTKGISITFGQWVAQNNIDTNSQEYKDKIPMIIYRRGAPTSEKGVAFVHDIGWYTPNNFNALHKDDMANAIASTRAIRDEVLDISNNNLVKATITGKRQTTFSGLKIKTPITLREANPQTILTIGNAGETPSVRNTKKGSIFGEKGTLFPNNEARLMNVKPFQYDGQIIDVRRYGTDAEGVPTYTGFPVVRQALGQEAIDSIVQAITIYANKRNLTPEQKVAVEHIKTTMGADMDITESQKGAVPMGIKGYLSHFINIFDPDRSSTNKQIEDQAKGRLKTGTPYISFIDGGNIVFGVAGIPAYINNATKTSILNKLIQSGVESQLANEQATEQAKVWSLFINPNSSNSAQALSQLNKAVNVVTPDGMKIMPRLSWYEHNLSVDGLAANNGKGRPIVTIAKDNTTKVAAPTYNDYLLDHLTSDIKSINIGTKEEPNYVTNIQPIITYDTDSRLAKVKTAPTDAEIRSEIIPENKEEDTSQLKEKSIEEIITEEEEKAKKNLGTDLGKAKISLKDPLLLGDEPLVEYNGLSQREYIAKSIDRIAGLSSSEQYTVTNFMFNQIVAQVNFDTKSVTKKEIDVQVEKTFDEVVQPQWEIATNEAARLKQLLIDHPSLQNSQIPDRIADYELRAATINSIKEQFDTLKDVAYEKVKKNTGITQSKQVLEYEEGESPYSDETVERKTDFWTDILTESPENKLSYSLRRFFGQTRKYDKEGKPMVGFLNLPLYEDSSAIIRTLMTTLVDIPPDYKAMIDKLKTKQESLQFLKDYTDKVTGTITSGLISRLENATQQKKNQFVTVMHNTSLRMEFSMIGYDRLRKAWNVKVQDATLNGIASTVKKNWQNNLEGDSDFNLILAGEEDSRILNDKKAEKLLHQFENWTGEAVKPVVSDISSIKNALGVIKQAKPVTVEIAGKDALAQELKTNLVSTGDRMKFSVSGTSYQITHYDKDKYQIAFLSRSAATDENLMDWLREFGITISPDTMKQLRSKGLYHNYEQRDFSKQFETGNSNGLFGILYTSLRDLLISKEPVDFSSSGNSPLGNSVVTSLANLEAEYSDIQAIFGFRINGKGYFAMTAPSFISDRARDLKLEDSATRDSLKQISFSSNSLWLTLLGDSDFRGRFQVTDDSAESVKPTGKKTYRSDTGLASLSDLDHEQSKISKFSYRKGEIRYGANQLNKYPGTTIPLRLATMFGLTMSDKDRMKLITTGVLDLGSTHLKDGISPEVLTALYNETVKPELMRMSKHAQNGGNTNIVSYDKGARIFLMMPEMNNVMINPNLRLVDAIKNEPFKFTPTYIENNADLMADISSKLKANVEQLVDEKLGVWDKNNYIVKKTDKDGNQYIDEIKFFDRKYLSKFSGSKEQILKMAAMDYEINTLISHANNFMLFAGDPAMYFKSKSTDYIQQAKDTFTNINKRLANQVAPGISVPGSEKEKYLQIFINDRIGTANNIEYLERILGKEGAKAYRDIKVSDAQEYTTWKEHLDILNRMGKSADYMFDITPEDITTARAIITSGTPKEALTERQMQTLVKVMQPIKPVYTGQLYDKDQDVMRTMYIKSSSFPLIPQLTAGLEIDKLRERMEQIEKNIKMNVRASYQTANKVGALDVPSTSNLWNEDGTINDTTLKDLAKYTLPLDRKNFRIQQEVPFKSDKTKEDFITLGTQLVKLLFGDDVMNETGFDYKFEDKEYKEGKDLQQIYTTHFTNLIKEKQTQLFNELGLNENGIPIDVNTSMTKLQNLLESEAKKRGYPLQDIKGLQIDRTTGTFTLPLWASTNSNRYESMLNAIVSKRMIAMKFPGSSFVTGSEEGFKARTDKELSKTEKSGIIYTSIWDGKQLQANQVFVPSKFRDHDGNILDLFQTEGKGYKYITESKNGFKLKEDMFDKELLSNLAFRIPTSGHQSASLNEIAGFLPYNSGDLIIVSKNAVIQKGLDFDVDKENAYQLWTHTTKDGKIKVLTEKHRTEILAEADKLKDSDNEAANDFFNDVFGEDVPYSADEINASDKLKRVNSRITEKLLQNEIIKITKAVYSNQSDTMQAKVARTLSTKFAEDQATMIDGLINQSKTGEIWTALGSEYQKKSMMAGASSMVGRGAYSFDVTFHSLAQQAANNSTPIELNSIRRDEENKPIPENKKWVFGTIESGGILGNTNTIDGGRTIAEVTSERQNMAVDNASLGNILGRLNLNDSTFDVDKVFNLLGIDKGNDGNSIPFLFLSQPIIRKYVEQFKNANSIFADFAQDKEQKIIDALLLQFDPETKEADIDDKYWELMSKEMDNPSLITALSSPSPNGKLQGAVLRRFVEMKKYGAAIRSVQSVVNFKNNGFGKSFFDVIDKRNALNRLGIETQIKTNDVLVGSLTGASSLIGDYIAKDSGVEPTKDHIDIGGYWVKPTTITGAFGIHATTTAYNLWGKHFPYDTAVTQAVFDEIMPIISNPDIVGGTRTIETKQDVFQGIKKYLAANKMNGITSNLDDVNAERARLYIDSDTNTSLAKYLKTIMQMPDNEAVNTYIKTNKLLNRFEYDLQKDSSPSKIKYSNSAGEEFDEQYLYEALSTLLEPQGREGRVLLPTVGNKSYTLDTLAQDLISYSYLGNAIQEAIQFTKYVPIAYLNTIGYSQWLNGNSETLGINVGTSSIEGKKHLVSEYTMQYVQHNPGLVKYREITADNIATRTVGANSTDINKLETFKLKNEDRPTFISIYNPKLSKGDTKYQLYWASDGETYSRIPVLGTFGMDEYQAGNSIGQSIVNDKVKLKINPQEKINTPIQDPQDIFDINSGDLGGILQKIQDAQISGMSELAKALSPYLGKTTIKYGDNIGGRGIYYPTTDEIQIDRAIASTAPSNRTAQTIVHEIVHALTVKQVQPFINQNKDGSVDVVANAPSYVTNLVRLYNDIRAKADTDELKRILDKVNAGGVISDTEYNTKYGLTNLWEFMAMSFTAPEFQKYLASAQFKQSGQTLLDRFKEIIKNVLTALGVKFESDSATAHAINDIFQIIDEGSKSNISDIYKKMADEAMNEETISPEQTMNDMIKRMNEETPFEPNDFPTKDLNIKDEKCL